MPWKAGCQGLKQTGKENGQREREGVRVGVGRQAASAWKGRRRRWRRKNQAGLTRSPEKSATNEAVVGEVARSRKTKEEEEEEGRKQTGFT